MKKDNSKDVRPTNARLRVASINLLHEDKNSDADKNSGRESKRSSRSEDSEEEKSSDLPPFYHHPRRPRNFDPL
jgi:hypothetical protein